MSPHWNWDSLSRMRVCPSPQNQFRQLEKKLSTQSTVLCALRLPHPSLNWSHLSNGGLRSKLSGQFGGKIRPQRKKSGHPLNLAFRRHLGWSKFCYSCLLTWEKYNISLICTELYIIKVEKLIFKKFDPFSALSVQNRQKFGRSFGWQFYFLFGPIFQKCGRTMSQLATLQIILDMAAPHAQARPPPSPSYSIFLISLISVLWIIHEKWLQE